MEENIKTKPKKGLKVFAYSLLCAASIAAIALSICNLTGCTNLIGQKGDQGEKGETGDKGLTGDQGTPGEKGDNGVTGDQGAQGDKGDQGEKGEKGETGDKGSKGERGDTGFIGDKGSDGSNGKDSDKYYNCTILPSKYGTIIPSVGSQKEGEDISFTVNITDSSCVLFALKLNNQEVEANSIIRRNTLTENKFTIDKKMALNGYVVELVGYTSFASAISNSKELSLSSNITTTSGLTGSSSSKNNDSFLSIFNNNKIDVSDSSSISSNGNIAIDNKDINLNLNGFKIDLGSKQIEVKNGAKFDVFNKYEKTGTESISRIVSTTTQAVVYVDGTNTTETDTKSTLIVGDRVEINGGTAIKQEGANSSVTIKEGSSIIGSSNGIEIKGGSLTIEGGTINSTASEFKDKTENTSASGAGILIVKENDDSPNIDVDITGGTIKADGGYAIYESGKSLNDESATTGKVDLKIDLDGDVVIESNNSDGDIKTEEPINKNNTVEKQNIVYYDNMGYVIVDKPNASVGDTIIYTIYPKDGYELYEFKVNGVKTEVTNNEDTITYSTTMNQNGFNVTALFVKHVEKGEDTVLDIENNVFYNTISEAIEAKKYNLKLYADNEESVLSDQIVLEDKEDLRIDLNGHSITTANDKGIKVTSGASLTIKGSGTVKELYNSKAPIFVSNTDSTKSSTINIGKDVTLKGWAGIFIGGDDGDSDIFKSTINLDGKIISSKSSKNELGHGIYVNGNVNNELNKLNINVNGSSEITSEGTGMYLAGFASTTIEDGVKITADITAIEIRAGNLKINGGTFTSNSKKFVTKSNGNGVTTTGAALAVVQHVTKLPINVEIDGGSFEAYTPLYAANVENNENEAVNKIKIDIKNGSFVGYSEKQIDIDDSIKNEVATTITKTKKEGIITIDITNENKDQVIDLINEKISTAIDITVNFNVDATQEDKNLVIKDGQTLTFNLENYKLTSGTTSEDASKNKEIIVEEGGKLNINGTSTKKKGKLNSTIRAYSGSIVTMKNVSFENNQKNSFIFDSKNDVAKDVAESTKMTFNNVDFKGLKYGFLSETYKGEIEDTPINHGNIEFTSCTFTPVAPTSDENNTTAILLCLNAIYTFKTKVTLTASRQCLVVRCGTVTASNCKFTFEYYGAYSSDKNYLGDNINKYWGEYNNVPTAMLVVGNKASDEVATSKDYQYAGDAILKLNDNKSNTTFIIRVPDNVGKLTSLNLNSTFIGKNNYKFIFVTSNKKYGAEAYLKSALNNVIQNKKTDTEYKRSVVIRYDERTKIFIGTKEDITWGNP